MGNEVQNSFDLSLFDRFDAATGELQIKISSLGIFLVGDTFATGTKYALHLNKNATVLAIKEDPAGCELRPHGNNSKRISCGKLLQTMKERGAMVPQMAEIEKSVDRAQEEIFVARLKIDTKSPENQDAQSSPTPRRYGPRKHAEKE